MWRRPVVAGALLLAIYVSLSFVNSPRGFLGTDTGGKVATLEVMTRGPGFSLDPDLGYWAEQWDPDGSLYPLYYTAHVKHRWVNVTTLPMLFAAAPLYDLGGYRLALLLPMLGSVATAFAARAVARRMGGSASTGWFAFWVVGVASPMTIYALDFWEHSWGVALMAWAVVFLWDLVESNGRRWTLGAAAGALLGLAFTLRTETLVYTAASAIVVAAVLAARVAVAAAPPARVLRNAAISGVAAAVAFAAVVATNEVVERTVLSAPLRTSRAAGVAVSAGDAPTDRLTEAPFTVFGAEGSGRGVLIGVVFAAVVAYGFLRSRRDPILGVVALACALALLVLRFGAGLGFVPGLAVAWPLAVVGVIVVVRDRSSRLAGAVALLAMPLVLVTQFRGGAAPQWAGRYILPTGLLLTAAGAIGVRAAAVWIQRAIVGLAAAVTVFGLVWMSARTHDVARTIATIDRRPEPVVVSTIAHLAREGGATYGDKRWLTAVADGDVREAATVVQRAGERSFVLVELDDDRSGPVAGWSRGPSERVRLFDDVDLRLTSWRLSDSG